MCHEQGNYYPMQIGNWSRWLADMLGMDAGSSPKEDEKSSEEDYRQVGEDETKSFILLDHLSDLLMLPKDMLVDRSVRKEVYFETIINIVYFVFSLLS